MASRLAVQTLHDAYCDTRRSEPLPEASRVRPDREQAVYRERSGRGPEPMGTTLTALVIHITTPSWPMGTAGPSCPRPPDPSMTEDHSLVAELVEEGVLSATEAEHHPSAHVVLRALGLAQDVAVRPQTTAAPQWTCWPLAAAHAPGEAARGRRMAESQAPHRACEGLVSLANERGGRTTSLCS